MADEGSIDDKAKALDASTATRRLNLVGMCVKTGIFYHPDKHICGVAYPCEQRVMGDGPYYLSCMLHNPELNPDAKKQS